MPDERDTLEQEEKADIVEETNRPKTAKEREEERARRLAELEEEQNRKREEAKRQKELKERRMKRKLITPGVMLTVGLACSITMYLKHFENLRMLKWLLIILIVAGIVGRLVQYMFERFAKQNDEMISDEGEVINKGLATNEEEETAHG